MSITSEFVEQVLPLVVRDHWNDEARSSADNTGWAQSLWNVLAETGLPWISVPEEAGGVGGDLLDAFAVLWMAGGAGFPLPLAECSILGGWLLASTGRHIPNGVITVAPGTSSDTVKLERRDASWVLDAHLSRVPAAACAEQILVVAQSGNDEFLCVLDPRCAKIRSGRNLANEPRDSVVTRDVVMHDSQMSPLPPGTANELRLRGALSRAVLLAGAMETVAEMTIRYSNERHQFGKPIGTFQAVAQLLVRCSSEATSAALTTEVAARRFTECRDPWVVAVAKSVTSAAAGAVAAHAHQVHGAIGIAREYPLHYLTRRLWSWRDEYGSDRYWNRWIGRHVVAAGPDALWPRIATGLVEEAAPELKT